MRILFIGDIVGKSGRDIVSSLLYTLKKERQIDLVIANGENSAHGKGITYKIYRRFLNEGIDYITMGNHTYSKSDIDEHMSEMKRLIVPYNHVKRTTGNYFSIVEFHNLRFCLTNILGKVLIGESSSDPFEAFQIVLNETKQYEPNFYFVDLHAETTAEKRLFLEYFHEYTGAVIGTHTHVQTADEAIIHDCAFISDVGMCGTYDSVIGRDTRETIESMIHQECTRYTIAEGPALFCAVIIDFDEITGKPASIERIQVRP